MGRTNVSAVAVQLEAIGLDKVRAALRTLETDATRNSANVARHYGRAARNISIVGEEAVRAGEIGGSGIRKLLVIGGEVAGMFGPTGLVIGALAVTGLAIFNYFDRARKQIEETAKKAREEMRSLRAASAAGVAEQISQLKMGNPDADDPLARDAKIILERRKKELQGELDNLTPGKPKQGDVGTFIAFAQQQKDLRDKIAAVNDEILRRNNAIDRGNVLLREKKKLEEETSLLSGLQPGPEANSEAALKLVQTQKAALERERAELQQKLAASQDAGQQNRFSERLAEVNVKIGEKNELIARATTLISQQATAGAEKAEAALKRRVEILSKALIFDDLRGKALAGLRQTEIALTAAVNNGTASTEDRARAAEHLADVQEALARTFTGTSGLSAGFFYELKKSEIDELKQLKSRIDTATRQKNAHLVSALQQRVRELEADPAVRKYLELERNLLRDVDIPTSQATAQSARPEISVTPNDESPAARAQDAYGGPMPLVGSRPDNLIKDRQQIEAQFAQEFGQAQESIAGTIRFGFANTLGDAIYAGFKAGFSGKGIGGVMKAFGKTVLAGIGSVFTQLGQTYLLYGGIMEGLSHLLKNPFTAGYAGLAIGAALIALGGALGAVGGEGGGGRGGAAAGAYASGRPAEITNIKLTATSVADQARYDTSRNFYNVNIIGTNDPKAQREMKELLANGERR